MDFAITVVEQGLSFMCFVQCSEFGAISEEEEDISTALFFGWEMLMIVAEEQNSFAFCLKLGGWRGGGKLPRLQVYENMKC